MPNTFVRCTFCVFIFTVAENSCDCIFWYCVRLKFLCTLDDRESFVLLGVYRQRAIRFLSIHFYIFVERESVFFLFLMATYSTEATHVGIHGHSSYCLPVFDFSCPHKIQNRVQAVLSIMTFFCGTITKKSSWNYLTNCLNNHRVT